MKMKINLNRQRGFSLTEMIVSSTILFVIVVGSLQIFSAMKNMGIRMEIQSEQRQELRFLAENLNKILRRAVFFFPKDTPLPPLVTQDAPVQSILLPSKQDFSVTGNALYFVGLEQFDLPSIFPNVPGVIANARVQRYIFNCIYLRTLNPGDKDYNPANPGSLVLLLYRDARFYNSDDTSVMWHMGNKPADPSDQNLWKSFLDSKGYKDWEISNTAPVPSSNARTRVVAHNMGSAPQKSAPDPSEYGLEFAYDDTGTINIRMTVSMFHPSVSTTTLSKNIKVLPRNAQ